MRARIYLVPFSALLPLVTGEKRIANLPGDAEIVAASSTINGVGIRVHSSTFEEVLSCIDLRVVPARLENRA